MKEGNKFQIPESEKERRKLLKLPITKELRYMRHMPDLTYWPEKVVSYEIVDQYMPNGNYSLMITVESGEEIRIYAPYFADMQKASFTEEMTAGQGE